MNLSKAFKAFLISYIIIVSFNLIVVIRYIILEETLIVFGLLFCIGFLTCILIIALYSQPPIFRKIYRYDKETRPLLPIKRQLTPKEELTLKLYYPEFKYLPLDSNGHIILMGAESYFNGVHYITPEQLAKY